jgi:hypothetical protein
LALGVRIINRGGGSFRFRGIGRLHDNRLFHGRFGYRLRFRHGRGFRSRHRPHRRIFLGGCLFLGDFFFGNFFLGRCLLFGRRCFFFGRRNFFYRRFGRGRLRRWSRRRRAAPVYKLEDYRSPASGGKIQSLCRALGKIHNPAFGGGYTARNGCDNLFIIPGICNLYLGS